MTVDRAFRELSSGQLRLRLGLRWPNEGGRSARRIDEQESPDIGNLLWGFAQTVWGWRGEKLRVRLVEENFGPLSTRTIGRSARDERDDNIDWLRLRWL